MSHFNVMNNVYKEELEVFRVVHFFTFLYFFFLCAETSQGFFNCQTLLWSKGVRSRQKVRKDLLLSSPLLFLIKFQVSWQHFFCVVCRNVSDYLKVQERDPKAHKFLGNLFEREGEINKAIGCYRVRNTTLLKRKLPSFFIKIKALF